MKRFLVSALTVAAMAATTGRGEAAILTIQDFGKVAGLDATWTLDATGGCTTNCTVLLGVQFTNTTEYAGTLLDGIQWTIAGGDLLDADLTATTAGTTANWELNVNSNLSQGGGADACGGGAQDNLCANYILNATTDSFGFPIVAGASYSWTFSADFASALPTLLTGGNIRALFNNPDGSNYNIFSPGGGTFQGQGNPLQGQGQPQQGSPEPASLLLFGAALTAAGMRLRRVRA